ncbi:MAG TPA: murein L,D-transpeptidase, partial [Polyangiaceae bacterium]|nr:murein L,D-transpeptidase [Polyangiaceae bacterium]
MRGELRAQQALACTLLACLLIGSPARAQLPPWIGARDVPLPSGTRSVQITRADEPLFTRPAAGAARRGTAALGALLPIYGSLRASGCQGRWLMVGALAWVCEAVVRFSPLPPLALNSAPPPPPDGLPHRYYFVGPDGSLGYANLALAEEGVPDAEFEPGFALAVVSIANKTRADPFGLTTRGYWVPLRDLNLVSASSFRGAVLEGEPLRGWVV